MKLIFMRHGEATDNVKDLISDKENVEALNKIEIVFYKHDDVRLAWKDFMKAADDATASDTANTAEVIIAKNRHGSVGNVKMGWIGQFTKFRTLEEDLQAYGY